MKRPLILASALLFFVVACEKSPERAAEDTGTATASESQSPTGDAGKAATHLDLLAMLHMADVHQGSALVIDFGTAARFKYTNGDWQSGWLDDRQEEQSTVSTTGAKAKLYLPFESGGAAQLRVRLKPYADGELSVRLAGKVIAKAELKAEQGFQELRLEIPAGAAQLGENELELRAKGSAMVDGKRRSLAVDWIRLEPADSAAASTDSTDSESVRMEPITVAGTERTAVRLAPGARLDWFVELPRGAALRLQAASLSDGGGKLAIEAKSDLTQTDRSLSLDAAWTKETLDLGELAGEVVRLSLHNRGASELALSELRVERSAHEVTSPGTKPKNVVLLLIDTLRASKLQLYDPKSRVKTPVLDEYAAKGVVFERAQAPENWTKPSVASVLTSLYPSSHRTQADAAKLPESMTMLSEVYQDAGFATASFVTNSFVSPEFGFNQGWDLNVNMDYLADNRDGKAESVFAKAGAWVEKQQGKPFFLYLQTIDPHAPYDPPAEYIEMYDPKPYAGLVENKKTAALLPQVNSGKVKLSPRDEARIEALHDGEISYHDAELGKFLAKLRELGLDENTLVVVTSDHGEEFGEHGKWGHGHSMYQELLHVPLVFWGPGVPEGQSLGPVVSIIDIGPTLLEASGVSIPVELEGRSLMGFMHGDWPRGPYVGFSEWQSLNRVLRTERWKLVLHAFFAPALYDLRNDPGETSPVDAARAPIAQRYLRILAGQFLGAPERRHWLAPSTASPASAAKPEPKEEKQEMTPELCRQLVALGYVIAECE